MKKILLLLGITTASMAMEKDEEGTSCAAPKSNLFLLVKPKIEDLPLKDEDPVFNAYYRSREFLEKKGYEELTFVSVSRNVATSFFVKKEQKKLHPLYVEVQYHKKKNFPVFSSSLFFSQYEYSLLGKRPNSEPFENSSWRKIETTLYRMVGGSKSFNDTPYGNNFKQIFNDIHNNGLSQTFDRIIIVAKPSQTSLFYSLYETTEEKEKGKILKEFLRG